MDIHTGQGHAAVSPAGAGHGSLRDYATGFILSIILTAAAFWVVMAHVMAPEATILTIAGLAAVQVVVHLVCFLHLNTSSAQRWNVTAMAFAVVVVVILIVGSLWIMRNMAENMNGQDRGTIPSLQQQP